MLVLVGLLIIISTGFAIGPMVGGLLIIAVIIAALQ